jgi:hypothetical protein
MTDSALPLYERRAAMRVFFVRDENGTVKKEPL